MVGHLIISFQDITYTYNQDEEGLIDCDDPIADAGAQEDEDDVYNGHANVEEPRQANLHPDDPANFFKLSKFLKIVLAHSITNDDIDNAEDLIRSYCTELLHVSFFWMSNLLVSHQHNSSMESTSFALITTMRHMYPTASVTMAQWSDFGRSCLRG
jgi:hypothetical protein